MKIEMGESLLRSWLRHVRNCQVAELNWKPSETWQRAAVLKVEADANLALEYFRDKYSIEIYGGKQKTSQFLKQAEVDVFGLSLSEGKIGRAFGLDCAFHGSGLNYGSETQTVARVVKKVVRTALLFESYFPTIPGEIVFASPKASTSITTTLEAVFRDLEGFGTAIGWTHRFRLLVNSSFEQEVLRPVLGLGDSVADTSELFLRSFQLLELFSDASTSFPQDESGRIEQGSQTAAEALEIRLNPSPEESFKKKLLSRKVATIRVYFHDGRVEQTVWKASNMAETSKVLGNLRSRPNFRNGTWQRLGIRYVEVFIGEPHEIETNAA